ncbi:Deoxyuridine 5'-triphosphate nucleotidohydrolase [Cladobotryum mycophilum]|uniref:Deoxyuridine 5'-triphosphate nucleotidohydrolase n=1 Tax=Cladobotryum mycophilum TaxID=491253 RepID=A0ABR0SFF5_9HYPO
MSDVPDNNNNNTTTSPPAKRVKTIPTEDEETAAPAAPAAPTPVAAVTVPVPSAMESSPVPALQIKKLSPQGRVPTRGSAFAAGYDLYAARDTVVPARGKVLVDTDISIAVPAGTYGRIAPRSGLASKHFIDTGAGVIDADYRGQVKVLLFNHAEEDYQIKEADRIAQLVLERIVTPDVVEVEELEDSVRGAGGFGSTGTA